MSKKYNFNLNRESKNELREKLDELLDTIEFDPNNRIHIPKKTLELIMFDYVPKKGYKRVGFHSNNLCKIDLSELSFKDINFGDAGVKNFDNTNIKLNFGELHKSVDIDMLENNIYLLNTSLKNVDLTENNFSDLRSDYGIDNIYFHSCNLSNTGLSITDNDQYPNPNIHFADSNLAGIDLSWVIARLVRQQFRIDVEGINCNTHFSGINNFYGTKISFNVDKNDDLSWLRKNNFGEVDSINRYKGCYFKSYGGDSTYINTNEENDKNKANLNRCYKKFVTKKEKKIIEIVKDAIDNRYNPDYESQKYDTSRDIFRLNKESKDRIRDRVSSFIGYAHFDKDARIKIPKNLLEELLFDYHYDINDVFYKTIGFTSHEVSKFDFSEVDFEDVSLDYAKEWKEKKERIFLADTNAKIDFTKTYEYKTRQVVYVRYADLGGLDLSNNNLNVFNNEKIVFSQCDLRDTNLKVSEESNVHFLMCDLEGNDFSNISLDLYSMRSFKNNDLWFEGCNLVDTSIKLVAGTNYSEDLYIDAYKSYPGCYLNGKKIKTGYEIDCEREAILKKYTEYSDNKISRTLSLVRKQINGKKEEE